MCFTSFSTSVENVNSLCRFFSSIWFRTWETAISCHNFSESSLTPLKFACALLFHTLYSVHSVLTSTWTVPLYLTWHFDHSLTLSTQATIDLYLWLTDANFQETDPLNQFLAGILINLIVAVWLWIP